MHTGGAPTVVPHSREMGAVPVIVVSGYLFDYNAFEMDCGARPIGFIQKPNQADQLLGAVDGALGQKAA